MRLHRHRRDARDRRRRHRVAPLRQLARRVHRQRRLLRQRRRQGARAIGIGGALPQLRRQRREPRRHRHPVDQLRRLHEAMLGHDDGLDGQRQRVAQLVELLAIGRIDHDDAQEVAVERHRHGAIALRHRRRHPLLHVGRLQLLHRRQIARRRHRRAAPERVEQRAFVDHVHLEQDGVERSAVDDLPLKRLGHLLGADETVLHQQRCEPRGHAFTT